MAALDAGSAFLIKVTTRTAAFLAFMLSFRWLVYGLALISGSLAYAVILIAAFYLKALITIGFIASLIGPCRQRMRSLGISPNWGLLVPTLLFMDVWVLMFFGPGLMDSTFNLTTLHLDLKWIRGLQFSCLALMIVMAMSLAKSPIEASSSTSARPGAIAIALGSVIVALLAFHILAWASLFMFSRHSALAMVGFSQTSIWAQFLVCLLCGASAILLALHSRFRKLA